MCDVLIARIQQVWEATNTVSEHSEDGTNVATFTPTLAPDLTMDPTSYSKGDGSVVVADDGNVIHANEVVYNSGPQVNVNYTASKTDVSSTTSNVCKVKPQQQTVMSSGHSPIGHSGQSPLGHGGPISPPPYSTAQAGQFNYQQVYQSIRTQTGPKLTEMLNKYFFSPAWDRRSSSTVRQHVGHSVSSHGFVQFVNPNFSGLSSDIPDRRNSSSKQSSSSFSVLAISALWVVPGNRSDIGVQSTVYVSASDGSADGGTRHIFSVLISVSAATDSWSVRTVAVEQ